MFSPTVFHMLWKTSVLPVKWMPARSGDASSASVIIAGAARQEVDDARRHARRLEHLASRSSALSIALDAGFQIDTPPISAGAVDRLPPIAVKLNGETA